MCKINSDFNRNGVEEKYTSDLRLKKDDDDD